MRRVKRLVLFAVQETDACVVVLSRYHCVMPYISYYVQSSVLSPLLLRERVDNRVMQKHRARIRHPTLKFPTHTTTTTAIIVITIVIIVIICLVTAAATGATTVQPRRYPLDVTLVVADPLDLVHLQHKCPRLRYLWRRSVNFNCKHIRSIVSTS